MHTHAHEIDALVELERNVAVLHPIPRECVEDGALRAGVAVALAIAIELFDLEGVVFARDVARLLAPVTESPPRTESPGPQVSLMFSSVNVLHCCGVSEQSLVACMQTSIWGCRRRPW